MKIFDRMALMLRADAHGVMDQLEERSLLLKQHLREAEAELGRKRALAASLAEDEKSLQTQRGLLERNLRALDADVDLALAEGKEELARFAVRRLLPKREAKARIEQRLEALAEERECLEEQLVGQGAEFDDLKRRVRARLAEMEVRARRSEEEEGSSSLDGGLFGAGTTPDEEVELELLRRRTATVGEGA